MMTGNHGFAEISTEEEATDAWKSFFGRFFSPETPQGVDVTFKSDVRQFTPRKNKDAKYQYPNVNNEEKTLHSDDFDDFLNGNTVIIPNHITLNEEGLEQIKQAIELGNYDDEAFKKKNHPFYAMWLFKQNKITRQQMTTILARVQIPKEYPLVKTFPIFNDKNELTKEALELWLPAIKSSWYGNDFNDEALQRLLLLISTAPKSEQIFFISKENPNIISPVRRELGNVLQINSAWHKTTYEKKTYDLHFSFGVIDALQIAKHGINGAAASRAKLGKIGIDAVKEGIEYYYRPTAISMPDSGVEATTKGIHEYPDSPMPAVTAHDVFHSKLHNTIPPEFHMMLNHMNQIIAKHTKQKWSKTMWELVDREFHSFQHNKIDLNAKNGAELFLKILHRNGTDKAFLFRNNNFLQLSDDGFAIVWHMINQSKIWKNLYKIDIHRLGAPYDKFIEQITVFKQAVGNTHHPEILTLKYHFFNTVPNIEFQKISKLIDDLGDSLITERLEKDITNTETKLVFGKYTVGKDKNFTTLKFKQLGSVVKIEDGSVTQLIPTLVNMQLALIFGEKNTAAVKAEVEKISVNFQGGKLTKETLTPSIDSLPSITAKLDFLEACYEEIIHSKNYTRRHAIADTIFSFFKNPLTTSQRTHIILLKETFNEILTEYQQKNNLGSKDIEHLEWSMKNRGSNLYRCNTARFYLHLDSTVPSSACLR